MFTLTRIIGVVNAGALQPSQLQVVGDWACPNGANSGIALEFRITSPNGAPTTVFTAVTNNGTNGPVGSVVFLIPAWPGATCGMKFAGEVRGLCNGVMTAWEPVHSSEIDCLGCPRIQMNAPSYAACVGNPATQDVTFSATVMLPPGQGTSFTWDFGDGSSTGTGVITNNTGNVNTPLTITTTHTYDDSSTPYHACLNPANGECPSVCVDIQTTCSTTGCPAITGTVAYGPCNANSTRPTTYTLTFNPPLPANTSAQVSWAYGGPNAAGVTTASQTINTSAGPVSSALHTTDLAHRAGGYNTTATVVLLIGGQLCPLPTSTVSFAADPPPCLPCPTPGNPITVTITTPNSANWCAPVSGQQAATLAAQVNWQAPVPPNPPAAVRYDWTVSSPAGGSGTATRQGGANVATDSGWIGTGANSSGSLNLSAPGTYTVSVAVVFSSSSGLPTDSSGAITCTLVGGASFNLLPCQGSKDCPELTGLTPTVGCVDSTAGTPGNVSVVASVNDPAGTAQSFIWDFGDPQSAGNQTTTATPNASHDYAAAGTFTVSCRVTSNDPNCSPRGATMFARSITVPVCAPPVIEKPPKLTGCAALLWTALILMLVGLLVALAGCLVAVFVPAPPGPIIAIVLTIIGAALWLIGVILFIIWWAVCRFLTECSVILAAWTFMGVMIVVFGVISAILAFMALFGLGTLPCSIGAVVSFGYWGLLYWIMSQIAIEVGCLTTNPGGPTPPTSSSSSGPLTGSGGSTRNDGSKMNMNRLNRQAGVLNIPVPGGKSSQPVGLGDLITQATSAVGIRPCQACHERAARLNQIATVGGRK